MRFCLPQSRNESEIEVEHILQPLNSSSRLVSQDLDEVRSSLVTGRLHGIIIELLDTVGDAMIDLCPGQGTVDS